MPNNVTLSVNVSAELRCANGVEVRIDEREVTLSRPGPKGGVGASVSIKLVEWDTVSNAVIQVRSALQRAQSIKEELGNHVAV